MNVQLTVKKQGTYLIGSITARAGIWLEQLIKRNRNNVFFLDSFFEVFQCCMYVDLTHGGFVQFAYIMWNTVERITVYSVHGITVHKLLTGV